MNEGKGQYIGIILISILVYIIMLRTCAPEKQTNDTTTNNTEQTDSTAVDTTLEETVQYSDTISDSTKAFLENQKLSNQFGDFAQYSTGNEETFSIENELLKVVLSSKGAQVKEVELKKFKDFSQNPLMLVENSQEINYAFDTKTGNKIQTKDLYFTAKQNGNSVVFSTPLGNGKSIEINYTLAPESYLVDYNVNFKNLNSELSSNTQNIALNWQLSTQIHEQDIKSEKQKSTAFWKTEDDKVSHLAIGRSKDEKVESKSKWLSFRQRFFNVTLLNNASLFNNIDVASNIDNNDTTVVAHFDGKINMPVTVENSSSEYALQLYYGPNDYRLLKKMKNGMQNIVDLSADFFLFRWVKWINAWLIIPLFNFLEKFIPNYGIIILIMTLIIKLLLMPLTLKSYVSMAKTKLLKPELEELKEKYKDDSAGYSRAQMELYSKAGVSMFGGCLPMLLQMPFLLAMFYFFPSSIELRQESFLWAQDLSTFDTVPFLTWAKSVPLLGHHLSIFTLLMTASSLLMARFNPQMQSQPAQPGMEMMKYMPYIFPFFLLFLFNNFPAALTYYYFLSNMITFGQQIVINKFFIDEDKLHAQIQENKKKPKKKSGFAAKMEEIYKQQQQIQEQQKKKK
ncbi:MAG: membrane protein insertase YidC [Chitinophagales bacterium]